MLFGTERLFKSSELGVRSFQPFSESLFFKDFINPLSILESSTQNPLDCFLSSVLIIVNVLALPKTSDTISFRPLFPFVATATV